MFIEPETTGPPSVRRAMFMEPETTGPALRQEGHVIIGALAFNQSTPDGGRTLLRITSINMALLTEGEPYFASDL